MADLDPRELAHIQNLLDANPAVQAALRDSGKGGVMGRLRNVGLTALQAGINIPHGYEIDARTGQLVKAWGPGKYALATAGTLAGPITLGLMSPAAPLATSPTVAGGMTPGAIQAAGMGTAIPGAGMVSGLGLPAELDGLATTGAAATSAALPHFTDSTTVTPQGDTGTKVGFGDVMDTVGKAAGTGNELKQLLLGSGLSALGSGLSAALGRPLFQERKPFTGQAAPQLNQEIGLNNMKQFLPTLQSRANTPVNVGDDVEHIRRTLEGLR